MSQEERLGLAKVGSDAEFVRELEKMNAQPKRSAPRRKPRPQEPNVGHKVRTYILETGKLFETSRGRKVSWVISDGGKDNTKILRVHRNESPGVFCEFYVDTSDSRFLALHTNYSADMADDLIDEMVKEREYAFDHAWFYSDMLKKWSDASDGDGEYFIHHSGKLKKNRLKMKIRGDDAGSIYRKLLDMEECKGRLSHDLITVMRGKESSPEHIKDQVHQAGCFAIKQGNSVTNHIEMVRECSSEYRGLIDEIEKHRLGVRADGEEKTLVGHPFIIKFQEKIPDLPKFIDRVFNGHAPFRLWGKKWENDGGYYSVAAVDMHEKSSLDFDIADDMMRMYMHDGSCGNTLVRLFTNLQIHYDTRVECEELRL